MSAADHVAEAAAKLGLKPAKARHAAVYQGVSGDVGLRLELEPGSVLAAGRLFASAMGAIPASLELAAEQAGIARLFSAADLRVGDVDFDGRVRAVGDELAARAVLGASARALVADAVAEGVSVKSGSVRLVLLEPPGGEAIVQWVKRLAGIALALRLENDAEYVVGANAMKDPVPGVRIACLDALVRLRAGSARTKWICGELQKSADPAIREAADRAMARLTGRASAGQVSVVVPAGGELSDAAPRGAVSDPDGEKE